MIKLKFKSELEEEKSEASCCCSTNTVCDSEQSITQRPCCPGSVNDKPEWVIGSVMTPVGAVPRVSTELLRADHWEHFKCRVGPFRDDYRIEPGLYAAGNPDKNSDVLVSANYKLSFDMLRRELKGLDVWILVLDTKGINVWCAAGKGTFGTEELINRMAITQLKEIVSGRRIIVPQLGAPGVGAYKVKSATGFNVLFGPVRAEDIPSFITAGYKAVKEMRMVTFPFLDRLVLTPMELHHIKNKFLVYALLVLIYFGLTPAGIIFSDAFSGGLPFMLLGIISIIAGALLTPALLPYIPFRSFAIKGWLAGAALIFISAPAFLLPDQRGMPLLIFSYLFFPLVSSYLALQFTGATTFTGMTGVKKELKTAEPLYIGGAAISLIILVVNKLAEWNVI
jgi:hypothetical protein